MSTAVDMPRFVRAEQVEALPPPNLARGPIAWVRENLFSGPFNTILTLVVFYLLYVIVPPLVEVPVHRCGLDRHRPGRPAAPIPAGSESRRLLGLHHRQDQLLHLRLLPDLRALAGQHLLRCCWPSASSGCCG